MIQPKRIHEFNTASGGELASSPLWIEVEVPDGSGGFYNRKTALPTSGTPSDVIQNVTATTATTNVDLDTGNLVFVDVQVNTEITLSNIVAGKKYRFVFSTLSPTKTVTFSTTYFNGSAGTAVPSVVVSGLRTSFFYYVVDFFGTGGTSFVSEVGRNLYGITEAQVVDTARQYTKGQGMTNVALSIAAGETDIDFTLSNSFTLTLTAATELQLPTNDRPFSGQVWIVQDGTGGWALTFDAGYVVLGDTLTTTAGDKALLNIASNGAGDLAVVINNLQ